jgi:hypothetical protein
MIAASWRQSSLNIIFRRGIAYADTACSRVAIANVAINVSPPPPPRRKNRVGELRHRAASRSFEQLDAAADWP